MTTESLTSDRNRNHTAWPANQHFSALCHCCDFR